MKKEQSTTGLLTETDIRLVHVVFGMPSLNCSRYGLCRIEDRTDILLADAVIARQPNTALAYMRPTQTSVQFTFLSDSMTEKDINKFFSNETFLIKEDKPLSTRLLRHLGLETAIILRGSYQIEKVEADFELTFKMIIATLDRKLTEELKATNSSC